MVKKMITEGEYTSLREGNGAVRLLQPGFMPMAVQYGATATAAVLLRKEWLREVRGFTWRPSGHTAPVT
jgi:hypothetical protein